MDSEKSKVIVVMPAYNTASILKKTFDAIPRELVDEIILVDDCSTDNTKAVAEGLGIHVIRHNINKGYGATQKTGYAEALRRGADMVVMLHSDNQYDPTILGKFIEPILQGKADVVTGSRIAYGGALKGGMPIWKYTSNIFLTRVENLVLGTHLTDFHNGYRAYSAEFLKTVPFNRFSDKFDFDTDIIIQAALRKYKIAEVPHKTRYLDENSQMSFIRGIIYGLSILKTLVLYILHQSKILKNDLFERAG
ncbi:MAG: glycosyltransferase family 2 protein [Candidatus Omnitrophica bacterium]|nr:glycosyltransferase family 2 protein [Candidatus Omnitrophota bacterium]